MTIPAAGSHAGPVVQTARIDSIDVLRGFALLGILLMNVQSFAMPQAAYFNPTAYGDLEGANLDVWVAVRMLADQKFMTIFSMLFGAGIVLMAGRAEARGDGRRVHYRRMGWLLVIGLLHAHLLWAGDILFLYAVCGMLVYPLRHQPPGRLIAMGWVCWRWRRPIPSGRACRSRTGPRRRARRSPPMHGGRRRRSSKRSSPPCGAAGSTSS